MTKNFEKNNLPKMSTLRLFFRQRAKPKFLGWNSYFGISSQTSYQNPNFLVKPKITMMSKLLLMKKVSPNRIRFSFLKPHLQWIFLLLKQKRGFKFFKIVLRVWMVFFVDYKIYTLVTWIKLPCILHSS